MQDYYVHGDDGSDDDEAPDDQNDLLRRDAHDVQHEVSYT
jgi:hypothetical protein